MPRQLPLLVPVWDPNSNQLSGLWKTYFDSLTSFAPSDATYITQTSNSDLDNEQVLSSLSSGFVKVTTATGVLTSTGNTLIQTSDLSVTGVSADIYGNATQTPVITVGLDGRITNAVSQTISGVAPGGAATGDLAGFYPSPTISASWVGSTGITTLGTITTGLWHGTKVSEVYGGTNQSTYALGDTLYSSASNVLSKLTGNTTTTKKFLTQTGDGAASAAPGWNTIAAGDLSPIGAALTRTNDTNVTLTLGGAPTTALITATSMTLGWSGTLAASRGGTGVSSLGDLTKVDDTNVTITLGGTPTGALVTSASMTLGWSGTLAVSRGGTGTGSAGITAFNNITGYTASGATGTTSTNLVFSTSPVLTTPQLGTVASGNISACTSTSMVMVTPVLGTPTSGVLTNCTGYTDANLSTTDITTNNASTSKHGFAPKYPNDATKYLDGTGAYTVPAGGGASAAAQSDQETATSTTTYVSPGRQQYHPSAAKFWVSLTPATTNNASFNVSSLSSAGTGQYTINFTTNFSSAEWACFVNTFSTTIYTLSQTYAQSASSTTVLTTNVVGLGGTAPDRVYCCGFGDQ